MTDLKLIALDKEDLEVISTHVQDAVVRTQDLSYLASENRFVAIINRFDWNNANKKRTLFRKSYQRTQSALRFERLLGVQIQNFNTSNQDEILEILTIQYEPTDEPEGYISIICSENKTIRLHVECIETELKDLGAAWETKFKPSHKS